MAKTANAYVPDRGEITLEVTAQDVIDVTPLITAETLTLDPVVRKMEETTPRTKEYSEIYVTGDGTPIKTISSKVNATVWSLVIIDDYTKAIADGELGASPWVGAYEVLEIYFDNDQIITTMTVSPAGAVTGSAETTFTNVDVQNLPHPMVDAESNVPNEVTITLVVESYVKAAHA